MLDDVQTHFFGLAIALGVGLLIGLEREWRDRERKNKERIAGFRTFGLIGLSGGLIGFLDAGNGLAPAAGLLGVAALLATGYYVSSTKTGDIGATTMVAGLATFAIGLGATSGFAREAAASGVITAILLSAKRPMHEWLTRLRPEELNALFRFLLISVVVLPVLPNRGFGPFQAFNPFEVWWMVVLISGLSFAAYIGMRLFGSRRGLMLAAAMGGLVSSTAVAVSLGRHGRGVKRGGAVIASGVLLASSIMFFRVALVSSVIAPQVTAALWPSLAAMAAVGFAAAFILWRRGARVEGPELSFENPAEIKPAIIFAAFLAAVLMASKAASVKFGALGLYFVAGVSGLADVDAITLTAARMARLDLAPDAAAAAIIIASLTNSVVKAGLATVFSGGALARPVLASFAAIVAAGAVGLAFLLA